MSARWLWPVVVTSLGLGALAACGDARPSDRESGASTLGDAGVGQDVEVSKDAACTGPADEPYVLRLIGSGFEEHEGKRLFVATRIDLAFSPGASCDARTQVEIERGAFDVSLSNLTDGNIYPSAFAFIDVDGNGACGAPDEIWSVLPNWRMLTLMLVPSAFFPAPGPDSCAEWKR